MTTEAKRANIQDRPVFEKKIGATPAGGDYSIAFFFDENDQPCDKESAQHIEIIECMHDGAFVKSTLLDKRP